MGKIKITNSTTPNISHKYLQIGEKIFKQDICNFQYIMLM